MLLGVFAKLYAAVHLKQKSRFVDLINRHISLEKAVLISAVLIAASAILMLKINSLPLSLTIVMLSIQTFFGAFFMSIIGIEKN
jgi:hypothetical protein